MLHLWSAYQFETFKANDKFINLVNNFDISKLLWFFKISIVKFLNSYPKMKQSSLSFHVLKKNFKTIQEIRYENASEFK